MSRARRPGRRRRTGVASRALRVLIFFSGFGCLLPWFGVLYHADAKARELGRPTSSDLRVPRSPVVHAPLRGGEEPPQRASVEEAFAGLRCSDPGRRRVAVATLGETRPGPRAEAVLGALTRALLEDPAPCVRGGAAQALACLRAHRAAPALARALESDPEVRVRRAAASALGACGGRAGVASLAGAVYGDESAAVRDAAAAALRSLERAGVELGDVAREVLNYHSS